MSARVLEGAGSRAWHPAACLLVTAVLAAALAGCSAPPPELGRDAAREFQSKVLDITEAAAGSDTAGALKLLDELAIGLDGAAARGEVSVKRQESIRASMDAVRADLVAQQAAAAEAAEAARVAAEQEAAAQAAAADAEAAQQAADQAAAAQQAADQAAAAQAAAAQAARAAAPPAVVAPAPAPAQPNPGKPGKAKGKDKNG